MVTKEQEWKGHCFICAVESTEYICEKCIRAIRVHGYTEWCDMVISRVEKGEPIHREWTDDGIQIELFRH